MPSTRSQAVLRPSPKTAFVSRMRPNDAQKSREVYPLHHDVRLTAAAEQKVWSSLRLSLIVVSRFGSRTLRRYHAHQPLILSRTSLRRIVPSFMPSSPGRDGDRRRGCSRGQGRSTSWGRVCRRFDRFRVEGHLRKGRGPGGQDATMETQPSAEARGVEEGQGELVVLHGRRAFGKNGVRTRSPEGAWRFEDRSFARDG
jgi:hypothetical protein